MAVHSRTTSRCLGEVATVFIAADGGRPNIAAKTLATLWYLLVLPDAQTRLHRQIHRKRLPWYAPGRVIGAAVAAANIITMPLSWAFLFAGKRNASRLACLGVLLNPPSIQLSILLVSEITSAIINKTCAVVRTTGTLISTPFSKKRQPDDNPPPKSD